MVCQEKRKKLGHGGRPSRSEFTQEIIHHGACWSAHTHNNNGSIHPPFTAPCFWKRKKLLLTDGYRTKLDAGRP